MLEKLHQDVKGNLKLEQRVKAFASVVALQQAIRRYVHAGLSEMSRALNEAQVRHERCDIPHDQSSASPWL